MKVVFLTLLLGLVCAAQEKAAVTSASTVPVTLSGHWSTLYIASNNPVSSDISLLLPYRCCILFWKKCIVIIIYIYHKENNFWKLSPITGTQQGTYVYTYEHEGTNKIEFIPVSEKAVIGINVKVNETGKETKQVLLLGKENDIDKGDLQKFKEETVKQGIPEENIKDLTKPDKCVSVA